MEIKISIQFKVNKYIESLLMWKWTFCCIPILKSDLISESSLGTSYVVSLKRGQTQKHLHSSNVDHQKALSYLKSNQKNQSIRNVSTYSFNREMDRLRNYQKEIHHILPKRKIDQQIVGKRKLPLRIKYRHCLQIPKPEYPGCGDFVK